MAAVVSKACNWISGIEKYEQDVKCIKNAVKAKVEEFKPVRKTIFEGLAAHQTIEEGPLFYAQRQLEWYEQTSIELASLSPRRRTWCGIRREKCSKTVCVSLIVFGLVVETAQAYLNVYSKCNPPKIIEIWREMLPFMGAALVTAVYIIDRKIAAKKEVTDLTKDIEGTIEVLNSIVSLSNSSSNARDHERAINRCMPLVVRQPSRRGGPSHAMQISSELIEVVLNMHPETGDSGDPFEIARRRRAMFAKRMESYGPTDDFERSTSLTAKFRKMTRSGTSMPAYTSQEFGALGSTVEDFSETTGADGLQMVVHPAVQGGNADVTKGQEQEDVLGCATSSADHVQIVLEDDQADGQEGSAASSQARDAEQGAHSPASAAQVVPAVDADQEATV